MRTAAALLSLAPAAVSEFVRVPFHVQDYPELRLAGADEIVGPAAYQGIAYNSSAASIRNFALSLDAEFAPLNRSTYDALRERYSGWSRTKPTAQWRESGTGYRLLDFLPPALQATSGLHFHEQHQDYGLPSFAEGAESRQVNQSALLAANCWGFAYAVMEAASNPEAPLTLSLASPQVAWSAYTAQGLFPLLQSSADEQSLTGNTAADAAMRNAKLQPGDLVLLWHDNGGGQGLYLDHVAVYLDEDLYFERSGSGDHVPFRVNTWAGLVADWPAFVFNFEWRRRAERYARDPLPTAGESFGLYQQQDEFPLLSELLPDVAGRFSMTPSYNASVPPKHVYEETYVWIKDLGAYVVDAESGRASLPEEAFDVASMTISLPHDIYKAVLV